VKVERDLGEECAVAAAQWPTSVLSSIQSTSPPYLDGQPTPSPEVLSGGAVHDSPFFWAVSMVLVRSSSLGGLTLCGMRAVHEGRAMSSAMCP
jgi:hypothetical protein